MTYPIIFLYISAIFCNVAFGLGPNLYPLRLILPLVLMYFSVLFFQKIILLKEKIRIDALLLFTILFFGFMFAHTSIVTYLRFELLNAHFELNSILNYAVLIALVFSLISVAITERINFFKQFNYLVLIFYILYACYALFEIVTGNHLETSNLAKAPWWMRHSPTVVFYNSNDFAAVFSLMLFYITSTFDKNKSWPNGLVILLMLIHIIIIYYSMSRLALILVTLFFVYRYPKQLLISLALSFPLALIYFGLANESQLMKTYDSIISLKNDLAFNERESTSVRMYLYKYALLSPLSNFGMGFGIDYSAEYYKSINDPNLHYIVNPHSFLFELLINSGVLISLFYIVLNTFLIIKNFTLRNYDTMIQVVLFNLILFSSSSSLFLWPIYLFFIVYICNTSDYMRNIEIKSKK